MIDSVIDILTGGILATGVLFLYFCLRIYRPNARSNDFLFMMIGFQIIVFATIIGLSIYKDFM